MDYHVTASADGELAISTDGDPHELYDSLCELEQKGLVERINPGATEQATRWRLSPLRTDH